LKTIITLLEKFTKSSIINNIRLILQGDEKVKELTINNLQEQAKAFCEKESTYNSKNLYGVTDGKAVGTYIEHKFIDYLSAKYDLKKGNSAKGVDLPAPRINTDIKVTSIKQPQSSSPFNSPSDKIYGLGYNLLVFVYEKQDNLETETALLNFVDCTFIDKSRTGDFQMTKGLLNIIENDGNLDDIIAFFFDKNLPADETIYKTLAKEVLENPPTQGYLTISNALQWRLQYGRIVSTPKNSVKGIEKLL
jgi:hypothetical protein